MSPPKKKSSQREFSLFRAIIEGTWLWNRREQKQKVVHSGIMRGETQNQSELFSYIPLETRVPEDHPPRRVLEMVEGVLKKMSPQLSRLYSHTGRPSVAPEMLLKALFLQVLYTTGSEGQLIEHLRFNLLYRWFLGLSPDDRVWDETVFSKNRERFTNNEFNLGEVYVVSEELNVAQGWLVEGAHLRTVLRPQDGECRRDRTPNFQNPVFFWRSSFSQVLSFSGAC